MNTSPNRRILLVDDLPAIHQDFRKILVLHAPGQAELGDMEAAVQVRTEGLSQSNEALTAEMVERKQLESRLVQSEKPASIGQLAAGVAHEINNPVDFVLFNVGTLGAYLEDLLSMINACEDAVVSIGSTEAIAWLNVLRERLELDHLREDIPSLMNEPREGRVRVRRIVQDLRDFPRIDAAQAMSEARGKIFIRTGDEGDQVWIEVADDGPGISQETLVHILDPFFTTKPIGKGTGLGLSVSYGVVQKHHGQIDVRSEVDQGTRFRFVQPARHPPHRPDERGI